MGYRADRGEILAGTPRYTEMGQRRRQMKGQAAGRGMSLACRQGAGSRQESHWQVGRGQAAGRVHLLPCRQWAGRRQRPLTAV